MQHSERYFYFWGGDKNPACNFLAHPTVKAVIAGRPIPQFWLVNLFLKAINQGGLSACSRSKCGSDIQSAAVNARTQSSAGGQTRHDTQARGDRAYEPGDSCRSTGRIRPRITAAGVQLLERVMSVRVVYVRHVFLGGAGFQGSTAAKILFGRRPRRTLRIRVSGSRSKIKPIRNAYLSGIRAASAIKAGGKVPPLPISVEFSRSLGCLPTARARFAFPR